MRIAPLPILLTLVLITACGRVAPTATPAPLATQTAVPTETSTALPPIEEITIMIDDFESGETAWQAGTEPGFADSSALGVGLTAENASQGQQALQLDFEQNDKPKAIFFLDQELDLSQVPFLQFDLYNPGSAAAVVVAVTTGQDQVWYESGNFPLAAGQTTRVVFDLTAGDYKAASTNWEFRASIADLSDVHRLAIIVIPASSGSVGLDNVLLTNTPPVH